MRKRDGQTNILRQWTAVLTRPGAMTFDAQRSHARWRVVWWSVAAAAIIEGAAVAWAVAGLGSQAGVSSLPFGPKLYLPREPLWLGLAAFVGSFVEFFLFSGLLYASARLFGGRGAFMIQAYLMALFWVPLMALSALAQPFGVIGSIVGLAARAYALVLLGPMLSAAHQMPLRRAWLALGGVIALGALIAVVTTPLAWPTVSGWVR
jgi:Yip1-like protein